MNLASLVGHLIEILTELDRTTLPPDKLIAEFFKERKYLGSHDRRFIAEAFFGIVRHKRMLEFLLDAYQEDCPQTSPINQLPGKYLALYLLYSLLSDQSPSPEQIVPLSYWKMYFPAIELDQFISWNARQRSSDLRQVGEVERMGIRFSFQDWMVREWMDVLGVETPVMLDSLNQQAPVTLRVNTLMTGRDECRSRLQSEGIDTEPTNISPVGLIATKRFNAQSTCAFRDGWYEVQDEGSQFISIFADSHPGTIVIDACAGAGGKTLHIAEIMNNQGEVIAFDIDKNKLLELKTRSERGGHRIITTTVRTDDGIASLRMKADLVLVDAPCSGTGTIRRNPGVKWRVSEQMVQKFSRDQIKILSDYSQCVKPGGRLVYSTCSLIRRENEFVVGEFLKTHTDFIPSISDLAVPGCTLAPPSPFVYLYPHRTGTDGFFIAMMKRVV
jgi:16S rRNA (cytosine967-C5)-methyltransferase